ncbi:MAG: RimK family alpha-L-glutamate ligase [Bacilli bacterium]
MKKAWLFFSSCSFNIKTESGYIDNIISLAKDKYNINLEVKNVHKFIIVSGKENEIYYDGIKVNDLPDAVILRRYEIYLARSLEKLGVKVYNNVQSMIDARNKMKVHQILSEYKVPTPKTIYIVPMNCHTNVNYNDACKLLNSNKFVLKWLYGSQGKSVHLVETEEEFNRLITKYKAKVICQEYIKSSYGKDIRCYVMGGKFIGSAIRKSHGDFRSNLAQGGEALKYISNDEIKTLAINAAHAVNLDICGVDILFTENGYTVCEVNALPGFKSIGKTEGLKEEDILLSFLKDKLEE